MTRSEWFAFWAALLAIVPWAFVVAVLMTGE